MGEPGVDAGGLEREWFLLVCSALFDPSSGLFTPQPGNGAFAINPSSGLANELHLEYFRFTGRVSCRSDPLRDISYIIVYYRIVSYSII